ncbi:hypothetical protein [Anaerorhabdus furcosa]|uniref:Uncharacterized protein n=1 Tax=Anaerorhabdus furcosa TaxID=118967 RepID=A0A1T4KQU0_9FIRM|nr:hypothetical protein [Anaerorhabdus furcosa]SJZ44753.1 hypothetical protein SAMN02745191_0657 [Anaerorhabdus furcosa]
MSKNNYFGLLYILIGIIYIFLNKNIYTLNVNSIGAILLFVFGLCIYNKNNLND